MSPYHKKQKEEESVIQNLENILCLVDKEGQGEDTVKNIFQISSVNNCTDFLPAKF
jgi:hypothetical protein